MPAGSPGTRRALPTGTVTFLFTDVEGSTRLIQRAGAEYAGLLERHRALLRGACEAGLEFGSAGDALFFAFSDPVEAIRAATSAQRAIEAEAWPDGQRMRVRIGVHTGRVEVLGEDYVGVEVHRVARICSAAHGGQVLVSAGTAALVADAAALHPLGAFQLKDFDEPASLCQVVVGDVQSAFPPPRTSAAIRGVLPREATSLVGRERELVEVRGLLRVHRLVTLTGAGGSGKTRLGLRVARNMAPTLGGPAGFVSLAPLDQPGGVPAAIGRAFEQDGLSTWDAVADLLRGSPGLLVLDNAEHLPGLSRPIRGLLEATNELRVLVTSRTPVGVVGEHLYPVEPLSEAPSVALLIERARAHTPGYDPVESELDELRDIAERLDGLPLALELAAARLRSIPAAGLRARLDRQLDVLKTTQEDVPERQRTIRAAIQWSYDLLSEDDRLLLAQLSVFAGPATLDAISQVGELDDLDAFDAVSRLVEASLLRLRGQDVPQYVMLEPVRQFSAAELESGGEVAAAQARMIRWFTERTEGFLTDGVFDGAGAEAFVSREIPNLMRLSSYVAATGLAEDVLTVLFNAANALFAFGQGQAINTWVASVINQSVISSARGRAMAAILHAEATDRLSAQVEVFVEALEAAEACGDPTLIRIAASNLVERGALLGNVALSERALGRMIQAGTSPWTIALDGMPIAILKGDTATATGYAEILSREPSHTGPVWEGQARQRLAVFYLTTGDTASAGAEVREAIALGERHNHPATIVEGHLLAARMSFRIDAPETLGDPAEHTLQAIRTHRTYHDETDAHLTRGLILLVSAALLSRLERDERAAVLAGALGTTLEQLPRENEWMQVVPAQTVIANTRERLGEDRWAELTRNGARLNQTVAVNQAEQWLDQARNAT